jgi:DNA polymerase-3 subunit alpha/error-prone DNA polymerase
MMISFSGYSFCKPHSASYAQVSFQAAYLKVHFPAEFMAAVISNQGGFYNTFAYVSEARRSGVAILGPDVNQSRIHWRGGRHSIRVGLMAVRDLSAAAMERIVKKHDSAPYSNLFDFFQRVRPDEAEARALILCGALDSLAPDLSRAQQLWQLACWRTQRQKLRQAPNLFQAQADTLNPPDLPPDDPLTRLRQEFKVLGFLCDRHPMTLYAEQFEYNKRTKAVDLPRHLGRRVFFAGWLVTGKVVRTKSDQPMEFLTFEDETGIVETTFFPKAYDRFCHLTDHGRPYLLRGKVEQNWGAVTLTVDRAQPLGTAEYRTGNDE